jgi:carbamoyl-phosphate synthase small subunit
VQLADTSRGAGGTKRCHITAQNHGYAVDEKTLPPIGIPGSFNANDGTNEDVRHEPFMSVQFHPEASPGPLDSQDGHRLLPVYHGFLFDQFIAML